MKNAILKLLLLLIIILIGSCKTSNFFGWIGTKKSHMFIEEIPFKTVTGVEKNELFEGIQIKYDSIKYLGEFTDSILNTLTKVDKYQVLLKYRYAEKRGVAGTILNTINTTIIVNISIGVDDQREILRNFISATYPLEKHLNLVDLYQSELDNEYVFKAYIPAREKYLGEIIWIKDKIICYTFPQKNEHIQFTLFPTMEVRMQLIREERGGDYSEGFELQYIHGGIDSEKYIEEEQILRQYLTALRIAPPTGRDTKSLNIYRKWIFLEEDLGKKQAKILEILKVKSD